MTDNILIGKRLSSNDISSLAQILEIHLKHYCDHSSPSEGNYIKELRTLVGLGFTAVLADGGLISLYHRRLNIFLDHIDFKQHQESPTYLCTTIAEMIDLACRMFSTLGYPSYYDAFKASVCKVTDTVISTLADKNDEVKRLLAIILKN